MYAYVPNQLTEAAVVKEDTTTAQLFTPLDLKSAGILMAVLPQIQKYVFWWAFVEAAIVRYFR